MKNLKRQLHKVELRLRVWWCMNRHKVKHEHLRAKYWYSSEYSWLYNILGNRVPMYSQGGFKGFTPVTDIVLFIHDDVTKSIYNNQVGWCLHNDKDLFYFTVEPKIIYGVRATNAIRKLIKFQKQNNIGL